MSGAKWQPSKATQDAFDMVQAAAAAGVSAANEAILTQSAQMREIAKTLGVLVDTFHATMPASAIAQLNLQIVEALDFYGDLESAHDAGGRLLAEILENRSIDELVVLMPRIKRIGRRGRPKGSGKREEIIEEAHRVLLSQIGRPPTISELTREVNRMTGSRSQLESISRDLRRRKAKADK